MGMMAILRPLLLVTLLACSTSSPVEQDILGDIEDTLVVEGREMDIMDGESSDVGVDNVQMKAEEDEDEEEDEVDRMGEIESTNEDKKQKQLAKKKKKKKNPRKKKKKKKKKS